MGGGRFFGLPYESSRLLFGVCDKYGIQAAAVAPHQGTCNFYYVGDAHGMLMVLSALSSGLMTNIYLPLLLLLLLLPPSRAWLLFSSEVVHFKEINSSYDLYSGRRRKHFCWARRRVISYIPDGGHGSMNHMSSAAAGGIGMLCLRSGSQSYHKINMSQTTSSIIKGTDRQPVFVGPHLPRPSPQTVPRGLAFLLASSLAIQGL